MEETTRAFALLAALTLALAPVSNGVMQKAAETADRVLLDPADWHTDPPEEPPEDPPEDIPEGNQSYEVPRGARASCPIEPEPVAGWNHPSDPDKQQTPPNRTTQGPEQTFEINGSELGIGVALEIRNLTGELDAQLIGPNGSEAFGYSHPALTSQREDVNRTSTIPRDELDPGEWTARLTHRSATYDRLSYGIVVATCAEDTS